MHTLKNITVAIGLFVLLLVSRNIAKIIDFGEKTAPYFSICVTVHFDLRDVEENRSDRGSSHARDRITNFTSTL